MKKRLGALVAAVFLAGLAAFPVGAAEAAPKKLSGTGQSVRWGDSFDGTEGDVTTDGADEFQLRIALEEGTWTNGGGVEVAIHWLYDAAETDLDIEVLGPDGELIAGSYGGDEDTESVLVPAPVNGVYTVRAIPFAVREGGVKYEGLAQAEFPPAVDPLRDLLPNLQSLQQRELHAAENLTTGNCNASEIVEEMARKCLRFEQIIANFGEGPLELRYRVDPAAELDGDLPGTHGLTLGNQPMDQRIYRSDGTYRDREADRYEFHPSHAHFHYRGFALSKLWRSNQAGQKLGTAPVATGRKNGFCLIDVENRWFGRRGDAVHTYKSCPPDPQSESEVAVNGISVGWADVYNWFLSGQYVEISNVPDGYYLLETIADPDGTILESNEADNTVFLHLRLCNGGNTAVVVSGQRSC